MNREIKFRAWDKEHKIMTKSPMNKINFAGQIHLHSGWADVEDTCYVLMQYIGLKDKNGTEIYEGDIVSGSDNTFGKSDHKKWIVKYGRIGFLFARGSIARNRLKDIEVIGNKFEHPELLEKRGIYE